MVGADRRDHREPGPARGSRRGRAAARRGAGAARTRRATGGRRHAAGAMAVGRAARRGLRHSRASIAGAAACLGLRKEYEVRLREMSEEDPDSPRIAALRTGLRAADAPRRGRAAHRRDARRVARHRVVVGVARAAQGAGAAGVAATRARAARPRRDGAARQRRTGGAEGSSRRPPDPTSDADPRAAAPASGPRVHRHLSRRARAIVPHRLRPRPRRARVSAAAARGRAAARHPPPRARCRPRHAADAGRRRAAAAAARRRCCRRACLPLVSARRAARVARARAVVLRARHRTRHHRPAAELFRDRGARQSRGCGLVVVAGTAGAGIGDRRLRTRSRGASAAAPPSRSGGGRRSRALPDRSQRVTPPLGHRALGAGSSRGGRRPMAS